MKKGFFTSNTYLNVKDICVVAGIFLFVNIIASMIVVFSLKAVDGVEPTGGLSMSLAYVLSFVMLFVCLTIYRHIRSRRDDEIKLESIFKSKVFSPSILLWGILLTLASQIVLDPFVALFPDSSESMYDVLSHLGGYAILLTVFIAPLFEELVFRGVVLNDIRRSFGSFTAIIASALLFSVIHLNMAQILPAFLAGIVFGYVYVVSRSIWSVIILHMINNALAYLFYSIVPKEDLSKSLSDIIQPQYIYYIIYVSALVLLIGMFFRLIFVCRTDNKLRAEQVNNIVVADDVPSDEPIEIVEEKNDDKPTKLTDTSFL